MQNFGYLRYQRDVLVENRKLVSIFVPEADVRSRFLLSISIPDRCITPGLLYAIVACARALESDWRDVAFHD